MASAMIATIPPHGHHAQAAQVGLRFGELPGTSGEERVGRPERPQLVAAGGRVDHLDGVEVHQIEGSQAHRWPHTAPMPARRARVNLHDMTDELVTDDGQTPVEHALAGGEPQRVGWFRFYFADEHWEWSPQVERMHGYTPGTVVPTTDLVLSHKHPDDYRQVAATLDEIRRTSGAFSTRHRIIDTRGEVHHVVVVGDQLYGEDGDVIGTHGFYVDVTPAMREARNEIVTEAVAEIAEARAGIEQAKGMLMLIYRINADSAFELLKWRSQETNVKLRLLAEQIAKEFLDLNYDEVLPDRSVYDRLLLTAHLRVGS
jgi:fructose-specific component phosphotransferase system IIB-like protein